MKPFLHLLSLIVASLPIVAMAGITSRIKADGHENVPLVQEPAADPARVEAEMRNLENLAVAAIQRNTAAANQQHQGNQCCRLAFLLSQLCISGRVDGIFSYHQGFEGDLKNVNQRLAMLEDVVSKDLNEQRSRQTLAIF